MKSQNERIKHYLMSGRSLSALSAFNRFGTMRLAARIFSLREYGLPIKSEIIHRNGKKFSKYFIEKDDLLKIKE